MRSPSIRGLCTIIRSTWSMMMTVMTDAIVMKVLRYKPCLYNMTCSLVSHLLFRYKYCCKY